MNYSDILASIVHDVKNSLSVVTNHVDEIRLDESLSEDAHRRADVMQQEMKRANNQLVQVSTLYKMDNERLVPNIIETNVYDFLEELVIEEMALAQTQKINIDIDCDEWLSGYFDPDLVRGVLSSTIGNAKRYTRDQILLSADEQDGYLVMRVEDNGSGFPESFLHSHESNNENFGRDFRDGRTQLGFFFAANIASVHKNRDREGCIHLYNGRQLGGGCFEICLP